MSSCKASEMSADVQSIPYQAISQALQIESTRELEDLIIDVMYAGLLGGKMHHDEKILHVDWVSGRDVSPESLVDIGTALQNWYNSLSPSLYHC